MKGNGNQQGTAAGSNKNINTTVSENEIECMTLNFNNSSSQQAEKIISVHGKNVTFHYPNANTSPNTTNIEIDYCPAPVSRFIGRHEELGMTLNRLLTQHKLVALVGMGGLGKTQLSRKYVKGNQAYKYKYWLESKTPETLENSFKNLAKKLCVESDDIDEVVNEVYKKMQEVSTILIFDNVEEPVDVFQYLPTRVLLPSEITTHVLITSRRADWTDCDEQIECYKLQPLDVSESLRIFQRKFGETCIETMQGKWEELAEMLGYLPLALQVAASYIHNRKEHNPDLSAILADYMEQVREGADIFLNRSLPEYNNQSIYGSMLLTLKHLRNKTDNASKCAVTLINAAAYMYPDYIYREFLLSLLDYNNKIRILDDALIILTKYSLLNQGEIGQNFYTVHRIIQISIRQNQTNINGPTDMYYTGALKYLHADDYMFVRDVLQYAHTRASGVVDFYEEYPSSPLFQYLLLCNFITAAKAIFKIIDENDIKSLKKHDLLYYAVGSGDLRLIELLLRNNVAVINLLNREVGETLLHCACRRGNMDIAKWLLQNTAAPHVRERAGNISLYIERMRAKYKIISNIIKTDDAEVHVTDNIGNTPLLTIDYSDNEGDILSIIKFLLENDADITIVDNRKNTVLHSAARAACASAVSLILEKHKDLIDNVNKDYQTALHVLGNGFIHRMQYLPEKDRKYLFDGFKQTARVLIMNGLSLHTRDNKGCTPLDTVLPEFKGLLQQVAVECNNQSMVRSVKRQRTE